MVNADLALRSTDIHWPDGFSPDRADLFAHNEVFINAPCSTVWRHLVEAEQWPKWYPNSHDVRILNNRDGVLQEGSRFEWDSFGVHIASRVFEFVPTSRLGWFGDGTGLHVYHSWLLIDQSPGCHVVVEEVANGPGAIAIRASDPEAMHKDHDLWNSRLKVLSESGSRIEASRQG